MAIRYTFREFEKIIEATKPGTMVELLDGNFIAYGGIAELIYEESTGNCLIIHRPSMHQYMSIFTFYDALEAFREFELR